MILFSPLLSRAYDIQTAAVAFVNEEPIAVGFFAFKLGQNRSDIFNYFANKYQAQADSAFWRKSFHGEVPLVMLKKQTIEECAKIKIQEILAKRYGVIQDISWDAFIKEFTLENLRRQNAVKKHRVIYGPLQYNTATYFSYRFDNLVRKLKEALLKKELHVSGEELRAYFETLREGYSHSSKATIHRIFIPYRRPNARAMIDVIYERLTKHMDDFDSLATAWNAKRDILEQRFSGRNYAYCEKKSPELVAQIRKTDQGRVSDVFESDGGFNIIKCMEKGCKPDFERIQGLLKLQMLDKKYARYIDSLIIKATLTINHSVYDTIFAEGEAPSF